MANVNVPVAGYPTTMGSKTKLVFDHYGPASYLNIGTSSHAGDIINASDLGFGGFDVIAGGFGGFAEFYSNSGNYIIKVFTSSSGTTPASALPPGQAFSKVVLQWFTVSAAFGAISTEVTDTTNLSAEYFRLDAVVV